MKTTTKLTIGAGVLVILLAIFFSFKNETSNTATVNPASKVEFRVGAALSLTGYGSVNSTSIKEGMDLAKDDLQAKGVTVVIDYQDDKTDPKQTVSSFAYFGARRPDVVVGPIWSYLIDAALPMIEQNKILTFTPSSTSEYIGATSTYLFQGGRKNTAMTPVLVSELAKYNAKKVAVLNINGAWGVSMDAVFNTAIKDAEATKVVNESLVFGAEVDSMPTVVSKIKASEADAILWTGSKDGGLALVKTLMARNMNIPVIGTSGLRDMDEEKLIEIKNVPVIAVTPQVSADFAKKFEAKYGHAPKEYADIAYDGLMLLGDAKKAANTQEGMRNYLSNGLAYKGYSGTFTFDANHDTNDGKWQGILLTK